MVAAYATRGDMRCDRMVDGRPLRQWLDGYNVRDDGAVINHNMLHPDYMMSITLQLRSFSTQSLAGHPVPEAAAFGTARVYRTLVATKWPSPPYQEPGGTIFRPGKAELYYPEGTDWSIYRFHIYYLADVYAHVLQWDKRLDLPHPAASWMRLRAKRIGQMQQRHADGHFYADGELDRFLPREQTVARKLTEAYLLLWLDAQDELSPVGDWCPRPASVD
jgi:hypothetical protein